MAGYRIPKTYEFENEVKSKFEYLISKFGFNGPNVLSNGDEYRDRIVYIKNDEAVEVLNAWHPSDYGFKVNYYPDRKFLNAVGDNADAYEMVYYKLKEQQKDLSFIEEGAEALRQFLELRQKG